MADFQNLPCPCFWRKLDYLTRIWGLLTSIVLLGVGVDLAFHHEIAGGFSIAAAVITFFLETFWVVTLFLQVCLRNENHPAFDCWDAVLWINTWKKTIIYCSFALILFVQPHRIWLSMITSLLLLVLGLLHLSYLYLESATPQLCLLEQDELNTGDRFDDVVIHGEFDDSLPLPVIHTELPQDVDNNN